ncbi:unnamed protein product [Gadus morhua 'NCC']
MTMFGLFYFQDGSVRADNTSVIRDAYRNKKITVNCREDLESEQVWIEVIWPTQRRQQEAKPIAAKLLFVGDTVREKFPNTMVSEIRALLRRKCNNEGYTKVAPQ